MNGNGRLHAVGLTWGGLAVTLDEATGGLRPGEVLEVRTDDPGAKMEILFWCNLIRHAFVGSGKGDGYTRYFIRKEILP